MGISAVVNVDNGWFEEDTHFVVPVGRFTVVENDTLMLSGVTEETFETQYGRYAEEEWDSVDFDYATVGDAYEGYGWN